MDSEDPAKLPDSGSDDGRAVRSPLDLSRGREITERIRNQGEAAVNRFIEDAESEQLYLDFKMVATLSDASGLAKDDRDNLAKAISGFGNSEGGVIVWGIDCRNRPSGGDVASAKHPIENPQNFKSFLESAVGGATVPPHRLVEHHVISTAENSRGFVVTYIPQSDLAPLQCQASGKDNSRYFMRAGSSFQPVPHGVLAGMFGRRPNPKLSHNFAFSGRLSEVSLGEFPGDQKDSKSPTAICTFGIENSGVILARNLHITVNAKEPGPNCHLRVNPREMGDLQRWSTYVSVHRAVTVISPPGFLLAPESSYSPIDLLLYMQRPYDRPFVYRITYGCDESPTYEVSGSVSLFTVKDALEDFVQLGYTKEASATFGRRVFGGMGG